MNKMIPIAKPSIGEEEKKAVLDVLESGMIVQGKKVDELEKNFAKYIDVSDCVAVSNGSVALYLALKASGIGEGDEVITTGFSFFATAAAILHTGAKPVFVDIGEDYNIDASKIEAVITSKTKAIMPVHLFGRSCDMDRISGIASRHDLKVIEDACQAHGASFNGNKVGSFGIGCFSLYATKNMMCGEGGLITTNDSRLADSIRLLRDQGSKERYIHEVIGHNFRMTDIQAAIAVEQMKKLDGFNTRRKENALQLDKGINARGIIKPLIGDGDVFHQYTIRVRPEYGLTRDALIATLKDNGIGSAIFYPNPMYKQKALMLNETLENTEKVCGEVLSLPVHPGVSSEDIDKIIEVINNG